MSAPSLTYTLTNGTTADASQVMQNFNDLKNGITDGTKDLTISALTCNGAVSLKGTIALGDAAADDITVTGSLASTIPIKTNNTYDVGSATLGLRKLYLGNAGLGATCDVVAASHATTREYTIPDCGAAANFVMSEATATINGVKTFAGQLIGKGTATNDSASAGYIGEWLSQSRVKSSRGALTTATPVNATNTALSLTAGDWLVGAIGVFHANTGTSITDMTISISKTSATLSAADTTGVPTSGEVMYIWDSPAAIPGNNTEICHSIAPFRISVSTTTTIYMVMQANFTGGVFEYYGSYTALRIR